MSYLDLPRLHFSGLFFTGPGTINNVIQNYTPGVPLVNAQGQYLPNAVWNPLGVSQWWLEECTVLSAIGQTGSDVDANDAVIGALVESPSPKTPMSDGTGGFYDIAKMVDLDPDQQGRSALYGVRVAVTLPNGAGLQGLMTIAELRQLNGRIPVNAGSWAAVGNWMGTLEDVKWIGDISGSSFLTALKTASGGGLAVKLTVDLHQNNPENAFTSGDLFCYGRVLGSIGPALAGELAQVVPGRCLQTVRAQRALSLSDADAASNQLVQGRERVAAKMATLAEVRSALTSNLAVRDDDAPAPPTPDPWNPAFAVIRQIDSQNLLSIDVGGSIFLNVQGTSDNPTSDGTFEVDSGITLGIFNLATKKFVAFVNGAITIASQYQQLSSTPKNCMLVKNSCVFTIPLTAADGDTYKTNPLAIQVNGTTVAQEATSGYWIDVSVSSQRLECGSGQTGKSQIMVRKFGRAVVGETPPVTSSVQLVDWSQGGNFSPSTDVGINIGQTDANGLADIATTVNVPDVTLPQMRQPLGSQVYYILMLDTNQRPIGDGGPQTPGLSIVLWSAFEAPANPSWSDIGPIFAAYARLYPGMKSRLDISDEATVVAFAPVVHAMMSKDITDAGYMPVTRDLSPSKMAMIVGWLKQVSPE
ncbi:MAG TPA: hypothetical protein VNO50_16430 [Pyrinomonadaceae bacterium]|nr:hypothetical protein [Pyrinomonadaceae bacterium]